MDISLSGAEIAMIAGLLASVTTPLVVIAKMLHTDQRRQIERLELQNERLLDMALSGTKAAESATTVLKTQRGAR